jgi:hypothetical protein
MQKKSVGPKHNTNEKYKNNKHKVKTQNNKEKAKTQQEYFKNVRPELQFKLFIVLNQSLKV